MLAFRYLMGASAGAAIALSGAGAIATEPDRNAANFALGATELAARPSVMLPVEMPPPSWLPTATTPELPTALVSRLPAGEGATEDAIVDRAIKGRQLRPSGRRSDLWVQTPPFQGIFNCELRIEQRPRAVARTGRLKVGGDLRPQPLRKGMRCDANCELLLGDRAQIDPAPEQAPEPNSVTEDDEAFGIGAPTGDPASEEEVQQLDPHPNPLNFPTEEEEVTVEKVQLVTLDQAIQLAWTNNRELQEARISVRQSRESLQEVLASELPILTTQITLSRDDTANNELNAQQFGTPPSPDSSLDATLQLTYDLYTAGRRPAQIRVAEEQVRASELDLERIAEQIRLDATDAYYAVQAADAQVAIERAAVADAEQSLRDAQALEAAGLGTRFDVLQAEVQVANAEQNLTRAISQQRTSRRQLTQILGVDQRAEVTAESPPQEAGIWTLSLEETIVLAAQNRAELEIQLVQREISALNQRIALADIKPQVSLFSSYNVLSEFEDDLGPADGFSIGAQMQWTLFDGGAARARARQEAENIAIAETRFDEQLDLVRLEVENSFFELEANEENIATARVAIEQARESLRLARLRFQAGVGTQTDVINSQTELTRARGNLLTAIIDYNRALASLQRSVSNLPEGELYDTP